MQELEKQLGGFHGLCGKCPGTFNLTMTVHSSHLLWMSFFASLRFGSLQCLDFPKAQIGKL